MSLELVKQQLYLYRALWHPTKKQSEDGQKSKVILTGKEVLSNTPETVGKIAIREIPKEFEDQLDQVEVIVTPF